MAKKATDHLIESVSDKLLSDIDRKAVETGMKTLEYVLKVLGDLPFSEVSGVQAIKPVNKAWENKPRSNIVKQLMEKSGKTAEEIAASLGCTTTYLNNKLQRESFSLDDIIIVAYVCGYILTFVSNNQNEEDRDSFQINVQDYLKARNEKALFQLFEYNESVKKKKKEEYNDLKARLAKMKEEYGFED